MRSRQMRTRGWMRMWRGWWRVPIAVLVRKACVARGVWEHGHTRLCTGLD